MVGRGHVGGQPLPRQVEGQRGGMLAQLALGGAQTDVDLAAGLGEQALAIGGGRRGDAGLFGGDLLGAAGPQRVDFAGQRLHLAVHFGELRRGGAVQLGRIHQVLADLARAAGRGTR